MLVYYKYSSFYSYPHIANVAYYTLKLWRFCYRCEMFIPLPIPNREVKPCRADSAAQQA
jgi:hypothetical protein